jgi:hypothetical protein
MFRRSRLPGFGELGDSSPASRRCAISRSLHKVCGCEECLSWRTNCHRSGRSLQHYQTEVGSPRDGFGATVGIELGEDRRDMELSRMERDS